MNTTERYFLSAKLGDKKVEREVSREEFMEAERDAGFVSKFPNIPATAGFFSGNIEGRVEYAMEYSEEKNQ